MLIYIAAPWADRLKMPDIAHEFEAEGHEITHKWWETDDIPEGAERRDALKEQAEKDIVGVQQAQLVVLLNTAKSEGKSFEQGLASAYRKPIIAVGKLGEHSLNVFHYLDHYKWVGDVDEAVETLATVQWLVNQERENVR